MLSRICHFGTTTVRKQAFHGSAVALGRPFKKRDGIPVVHQAQRPAAEHNVDFASLGLKYEMKYDTTPVIEWNQWKPKPELPPDLPFMVDRAGVSDQLPVYTEFKGGRTKVVTILRKIKGDIEELKNEVQKVVGQEVELRPGKIVIYGNYVKRLKIWLTGLGF